MKSEMLCPIAPIGSNVQLGLRANSLEAYPLQDATYMIHHGNTYEIGIKNNNSISVSAQIQIDGKTVGTFVIKPYGMSWIERPVNEQRKFTFYRLDSREANDAKLDKVSHSDLGLIKVIVKHEQRTLPTRPTIHFHNNATPCSAGGTGLSDTSDQHFKSVSFYGQDTSYEFNLRLVVNNTPQPLVDVTNNSPYFATPVPPPVSPPHHRPSAAPAWAPRPTPLTNV